MEDNEEKNKIDVDNATNDQSQDNSTQQNEVQKSADETETKSNEGLATMEEKPESDQTDDSQNEKKIKPEDYLWAEKKKLYSIDEGQVYSLMMEKVSKLMQTCTHVGNKKPESPMIKEALQSLENLKQEFIGFLAVDRQFKSETEIKTEVETVTEPSE